MNRQEFISAIEKELCGADDTTKMQIVEYFEEIFADGIEAGRTEEDLAQSLGDPHIIVKEIAEEYGIELENKSSFNFDKIEESATEFATNATKLATEAAMMAYHVAKEAVREAKETVKSVKEEAENAAQNGETYEPKLYVFEPKEEINLIKVDSKNIGVKIIKGEKIKITVIAPWDSTINMLEQHGIFHVSFNSQFKFRWKSFFQSIRAEITIEIPENYNKNIEVNTSNAKIFVGQQNFARAEFETSNATIEIIDTKADSLVCSTGNASLEILNTTAQHIIATTSNAPIRTNALTAKKVALRTSNSSVTVDSIKADEIEIHSSNGAIRGNIIGCENDYAVSSSTSNGPNNLVNTRKMTADCKKLDVTTSNGAIQMFFIG